MRSPNAARRLELGILLALLSSLLATSAHALDKQGSAHGGAVEQDDSGLHLGGYHFFAISPYNPSYAARPDNTGLALLRYGTHMDLDFIGRKLSVPVDLNFFTDRTQPDIAKLGPTEFDIIAGVTTTWSVGHAAIEGGARIEHDRAVDRGDYTQTYVDLRVRLLYSLASVWPRLGKALADGGISGAVTLGGFAWNPTYAARPDNTGLALLRYAAHTEISFWHDHFAIGADANLFTDRHASGAAVLRPTELDVTGELIGRYRNMELHVAWESDLPVDQAGLVQSFLYVSFVWTFDIKINRATSS